MSLLDLEAVTFIDFAALEDAMPKQACEHKAHDEEKQYHADGMEHYVLAKPVCPCHRPAKVIVACQKFLEELSKVGGMYCSDCLARYTFWDRYEDLGLIEGKS